MFPHFISLCNMPFCLMWKYPSKTYLNISTAYYTFKVFSFKYVYKSPLLQYSYTAHIWLSVTHLYFYSTTLTCLTFDYMYNSLYKNLICFSLFFKYYKLLSLIAYFYLS